ncbi:DUF4190 domain-containing protein [Leifsonia sp. Leaf264]|uniref:DUF4190 domain-containing protein n=1 Tax=Leifsonia sp. Leaf264 TaxID=1736314 RepID=UPI0006F42CF2|nr:DUF4190 domain-containing protein [Leifsonia sp. Leaf264]KQO96571.1 hypothetical protein ASF30_15705 [Leifsonia sp. Leaf264]
MTGFSEMPGQDPLSAGYNPEHLEGFEADPLPPLHGADDPGRTLGIIGLVLAIFFNIIGLIVSIVAYNKSRKAGYSNGFAVAGIIVGAVLLILAGVLTLLLLGTGLALFGTVSN